MEAYRTRRNSRLTTDHREEQQPLEDFFKAKGLKVRNEMNEEVLYRDPRQKWRG